MLGKQLLVFRGRGGTGKTVRLLQLGRQLYAEHSARVLLLTYNNALAADIRRLLALLRIQNSIGDKAISVKTVHKFIRDWLSSLKLLEDKRDFIAYYNDYKSEFLGYLTTETLEEDDVQRLKADYSADLTWDFILIDECQDWPGDERDILYKLYGHKRLVIADGVDQLVRDNQTIDWRATIDVSESQVVPLRKSLRLKSGLCGAICEVARVLNVPNWDLQPVPDIYGGRVIVLAGAAYDRSIHSELIEAVTANGNELIDMLFCVPPGHVLVDKEGDRTSALALTFAEWGHEVWDGTSYSTRGDYPTSNKQMRIVQYDSCRGLEGWAVVCLALDSFFDFKYRRFQPTANRDLFTDHEEQAADFANRWVMIPLTRAIDTLVVQLEDTAHPIATAFQRIAQQHPDIVEWRS